MEDFILVWKQGNLRTLLCCFVTLFIFNSWILHPRTYLWEESQIKGSLCSRKTDTLWSFGSCFSQAVQAILPLSHIPPHTHAAYSKQMLASASATLILKWLPEPYLLCASHPPLRLASCSLLPTVCFHPCPLPTPHMSPSRLFAFLLYPPVVCIFSKLLSFFPLPIYSHLRKCWARRQLNIW